MSLAASILEDLRLLKGQLPPSAKPIIDRLSNNIDQLIADDQDSRVQSQDANRRLDDMRHEYEDKLKKP